MTIRHLKTLGFLELSLGDFAAAEHRFSRALERSVAVGYGEPGFFRLDADAIESLVALGRLDEAGELTDQLAERGLRLGRPWASAAAERSRGLLAAARGELDEAESRLACAAAALERLPQPLEHGRTLLLLGTVRRRLRQKRRARDELERALATFEALPAPLWAQKAREELSHIGGRSAAAGGELTATERQVAELVADGLTNREVASRLYVSEKTIEFHLRNVFRKVDVRSRTELARALPVKH
jgi:DNA-binding CsgD family transcriptional regulator